MKQVKLQNLTIRNFRGLRDFVADFGGESAIISGETGTGKTSVLKAFEWLLFGSGTGSALSPLDIENRRIAGLVTSVTAELDVNGRCHVFQKEQHEKTSKGNVSGHKVLYFFNEVPVGAQEYAGHIVSILPVLPANLFHALTHPHYFFEEMDWCDRRVLLLGLVGDSMPSPDGFDDLTTALDGRTMDQYKAVLLHRRAAMTKELSMIHAVRTLCPDCDRCPDRLPFVTRLVEAEKGLARIEDYFFEESRLIEAAVNERFDGVQFKLFNRFFNGEYRPCCEGLMDGVPFSDLSCGEQIIAGTEVIDTVSDHCRLQLPLFMDNMKSLTRPLLRPRKWQTIYFYTIKGVRKLQVKQGEPHGK